MTESQSRPDQDTTARAAAHFAKALSELHDSIASSSDVASAREELRAARESIERLAARMESQIAADQAQRQVLGDQLAVLAGSLEKLVSHLQGLSQLMSDLLQGMPEGRTGGGASQSAAEPVFRPGPEGLSLAVIGVPGFQALMDFQKALAAMPQVAGASVERYQEGDSRILVHLREPVTGAQIASWLKSSTSYGLVVEEAKPDVSRLRLKVVS